jgi:trimethylamine--corrinoid protein Co-methyltransferase
MKPRKGLPGGQYRPLTEEQIESICQTTFKVLEEVGVQVNLPEAWEMFKQAGAKVADDSTVVKIPQGLAKELLSQAPAEIVLHGREKDGSNDLLLGGTRVYMGTGGTALNVQDPGNDDNRPSQLKDIGDMARTVDALENIHFYMLNVFPNDLEGDEVDVNRFGAALNRTTKHIMGGVYTVEGIRAVAEMASTIAGSPQALSERPFISMVTCTISPLKLDEHYSALTLEAVRNGIPVVLPAEPLCGATAPVTLAGNLVIQNADSLAGIMLTQLAKPGAPAIYGSVASTTDLRDMKYLSGAVEMGLLNAATAQLAQHQKLPYYATAGMSDSKKLDAQAGYESALTNLMVALAGGNFIHDAAGFLEFCMTASFDKLVMDNEIIGMVMRAVEGIRVNEQTLAFDLIKEVGPGGHFIASRHTRKFMRQEQYITNLSDRDNRQTWQDTGALDTKERATKKAREILDRPAEQLIPEAIREKLVRSIPGLRPEIMDMGGRESAA